MPNLAQGDLHGGQDVVPPAPSSARKLPPTPGGAGRREGAQQPQSPAVSRNIFALHNAGNTADGTDKLGMLWRINGAAIFSKGANMIPMEELEGRV